MFGTVIASPVAEGFRRNGAIRMRDQKSTCIVCYLFLIIFIAQPITCRTMLGEANGTSDQTSDQSVLNVTIQDEAPYFVPKRTHIEPGTTVTWSNVGPSLIHTILIRTAHGNITSGSITPHHSWTHKFAKGEDAIVRTSCEIHPYMYGYLIVGSPSAELVRAIDSQQPLAGAAGLAVRYREFPLPIAESVPGILATDADDAVWFTMGGGGYGNISSPPQSRIGRLSSDGDLTVYDLPTPAAGPSGLVLGEHGIVYVTEFFGNKIARIDTASKVISEIEIPTPHSWPTGIAIDGKGNVWFNETSGNKIGKLTPRGFIVEYPLPTTNARATGLAVDKQGTVWISERDGNKIASLSEDGTIVEYAVPTQNAKPTGIAIDAEDHVWFGEREGNKIGLLVHGSFTEYPLPQSQSGPFIVLPDREGKVWVSEIFGNRIAHLDPASGKFDEYKIPSTDSWPAGIASDSTGNIWYASQLKNRVGVLMINAPSLASTDNKTNPENHDHTVSALSGHAANR